MRSQVSARTAAPPGSVYVLRSADLTTAAPADTSAVTTDVPASVARLSMVGEYLMFIIKKYFINTISNNENIITS